MHCVRCHGLMVRTHMMDFDGTSGHMWTASWRCMNCGHVDDDVVQHNRRVMSAVYANRPADTSGPTPAEPGVPRAA